MASDHPSIGSTESLQAAMACLDLSLESELALYRRHHAQTLLALTESDRLEDNFEAAPSVLLHNDSATADRRDQEDLSLPEPDAQLIAESRELMPLNHPVDESKALVPFMEEAPEDAETLPKPYGAEITAEPKAFERFLDPSIEDYLESSEALLKHLEDSAASTDQQVKKLTRKSWLTTLRNIAIALGCLGVIGFLVTVMVQSFTPKSRKIEPAPQSSAQPLQVPNGSAASILADAANAKSLNPKQLNPLPSKDRVATMPTSRPKTLPLVSPAPLGKAAYYAVVADYTNAESFQKARKRVPDAFITNFGGQQRIQLAWLNELQPAQQLVEDLKHEGFAASIVAQN
jgi:preprotein translocase subunit Sss1